MNDSNNRLSGLKRTPKTDSQEDIQRADKAGEGLGFHDRSPRKTPGRKPSPRTYQLHPKVLPDVGEAIAAEADRLGLTQGLLIERMWETYSNDR